MKLGGFLAVSVAVLLVGCAAEQPPVSPQVQAYYDEHVVNRAPVTQAPPQQVVVIGDSYSQGTGAGTPALGWVSRLSFNQSWEITNLARGGTGYATSVREGAKDACGLDYCPSYPEMVAAAKDAAPAVVLVAGGRNDSDVDPVSESVAIRDFYSKLREALPSAKIAAFNPVWDDDPAPASLVGIAGDVKAAVESVGGVYVDSGQPLASRPELVAPDGIHPNPAGHAAIFEANLEALQAAGVAGR